MERFFRNKLDHLLFWLLTIGFHAFTQMHLVTQAGTGVFMLEVLIRNSLLAIVLYVNLLVTVPAFIRNKSFVIGSGLVVLEVGFYALAKSLVNHHLYVRYPGIAATSVYQDLIYNASIVVFYLVFSTTLYFTRQWYLQNELIRKIQLEKLNTELEYLKAQINPHFLFNSLNTVFFQIDRNNAVARETLSRFSEMLRYQLYECNIKEIDVEKEIKYLKNYVELQRLRKDEHYHIQFTCPDDLTGFSIPPLLLLPFIENAFKHVSHFTDRKNIIDINLEKSDNQFSLKVYNTINPKPARNAGGIGLKNVQRRLELLYPHRYKLKIDGQSEIFSVQLTLTLAPA